MGMMMLMLRSFALIVVQRHTAASRSRSPSSTGQHVCLALPPIPMCISPPRTSTQAPSFNESMGHVGCAGGGGGGHGVSLGGVGGVTTGGVGTYGGGEMMGGVGTTGGNGTYGG
ncbi:hypothetical protein Ahy_A04g021567 [Arachis hypogaea]|uniref:Uncharacterized protein n=1 Tax=Arachis hypogaea TaxID=3818 RepID=A0A445DKV0_ARAHY|nr:hypothetical protein Ahy_A04g021567 [Arachis hypogaea]